MQLFKLILSQAFLAFLRLKIKNPQNLLSVNNRDRLSHIKLSSIKCLLFISTFLVLSNNCASVKGQIVPDDTLGNESSQVRDNLTIDDLPAELIEGGALRDSNLFHSFSQFNVEAGRGAYFANPEGIANIFSRVTGGNVSEIMGRLGVQGNADLFLINPNGIIFGENSSLDLNGSFVGSSADSIVFGNDFEFSTVNPEVPPLLTVNQPLGLNLGNNPGEIVNNSITDNVGLQVLPGNNISLIGGDITLNRGIITAPGGAVNLGGLAGFVAIDEDSSFEFPLEVTQADISLTNGAAIDVRADGGGSINLNANNIELIEASNLLAGIAENASTSNARAGNVTLNAADTIFISQGSRIENQVNQNSIGNSGNIAIDTGSFLAEDEAIITTDTFGQGNGGLVSIQASDDIELSRIAIFSDVNLLAQGNTGGIEIDADSISISDLAIVSSSVIGQGNSGGVSIQALDKVEILEATILSDILTEAQGNSGAIEINTGSLSVTASRLETSNVGRGNAGSIDINANDNVSIQGSLVRSLLGSSIEGSNSGDINIDAESLLVTEGAELNSSLINGGKGRAGNIVISANDRVTFDGGFARSRLEKGAEGSGGDLLIDTGSLLVTGVPSEIADANTGQLTTATFGRGDAGDVIIDATDDISFDGRGSDIFSLVAFDEGIGDGGNIEINSSSLSINNQARLIAANEAYGDSGDIIINTDSFSIANEGQVGTDTREKSVDVETARSRNGGTIEINTRLFIAENQALLNAGSSGIGNAGSIIVNASESALLDNKVNISARTLTEGNGGNITINTNHLKLKNSLIDVSTFGMGNAGTIAINATESLEVSGFGLASLQEDFINLALADPDSVQNTFSLENHVNISASLIQGIIAFTSGAGEAGGIEIDAPRLSVSDGSIIGTSSIVEGDAGSIVINAPELLEINEANITTSTIGAGNAGDLEINTGKLSINNGGQIDATTFQKGNGGNLTISATESVELNGTFNNNNSIPSSLLVGAQREATTGNSGNLQVFTPRLTLRNGAAIDATTLGQGDGGNINLEISDLLLLRNNSTISTRAGISEAGGNGGNIDIDAGLLVAFPSENSDIDANAFQGRGGAIQISTQGIFGIAEREAATPLSDITAFSQQNPQLDGEISIETPDTDLNRELTKLPEDFIDISALIVPTCPRDNTASGTSEFIVTGRGGLPPEPEANFRLPAIAVESNLAKPAASLENSQPASQPIVEATRWIRDANGKIILLAPHTTASPNYHTNLARCNL